MGLRSYGFGLVMTLLGGVSASAQNGGIAPDPLSKEFYDMFGRNNMTIMKSTFSLPDSLRKVTEEAAGGSIVQVGLPDHKQLVVVGIDKNNNNKLEENEVSLLYQFAPNAKNVFLTVVNPIENDPQEMFKVTKGDFATKNIYKPFDALDYIINSKEGLNSRRVKKSVSLLDEFAPSK